MMAYIKMIKEEDAHGDVKSLYDTFRAPWGGVDNILKIHSLLPHTLKPHVDLYRSVMFGNCPLTRRQREMIAVVVSVANQCTYCVHHHSDALYRLTKDKAFTDGIRRNYKALELSDTDRIMLEFAEELTLQPGVNHSSSALKLQENGFTDEAILHITLIIGYFNFVNRIALGLGVELENYWGNDRYSDPSKQMSHDPYK
ncbi:MAG: peroxidase-related enzyme [Ignavibacteriae bacterium]|nr:peroxidase-related enzyme [Ignavibacteriota bacterium]